MTIERFLIANTRVGMEKDLEPFLLPSDAYPDLEDCYLFRGRVKKRRGYRLLGRLNRQIGTTDGAGNEVIDLKITNIPIGISQFVIAGFVYTDRGGANPVTMISSGPGSVTLDRITGILSIIGATATSAIFYFPGFPVMGLRTQETTTINQTALIGFDTSFAYVYNNSSSKFIEASTYKTSGSVVAWTGPNYQQFWTTNYADAMWTTNFNPGFQGNSTATTIAFGDGIRWFDQDQSGWVNFLPPITGALAKGTGSTYLLGALIIVPYKNRLVVLNTFEGANYAGRAAFQQRARWSQNGTPYNAQDQSTGSAPIPTNFQGSTDSKNQAWSSDVVGKGGYVDAPTNEAIVAAEFVKDTLIVYFERSTWNLRYTGNEVLPFIWEKINTELGSESTFSLVPFDKIMIGISNVGIHSCDTVNVDRIDLKIPDDIFQIEQLNNGPQRVSGIRDYLNELIYWAMPIKVGETEIDPDSGETVTFPNKILCYNYRDQSFSYFNDSFTSFGYIEAIEPGTSADLTWGNASMTWAEADFLWISPVQDAQVVRALGGNQQGFVEILQEQVTNDDSLFISNITITGNTISFFSPNHNLQSGFFIYVTAASGVTGITGNIYEVNVPLIGSPLAPDPNNFTIQQAGVTGAFTGQGTIQIVNNISILTKRFNPYMEEASQARIHYMDFYFDTTPAGQVSVNLFINEDSSIPVNSPAYSPALSATNVINTFPESTYAASPDTNLPNSKLWKRIYFDNISQLYQIQITLSDIQMVSETIRESDVVLHGIMMYFSKAGRMINV